MLEKYSSAVVFAGLMGGLALWSDHLQISVSPQNTHFKAAEAYASQPSPRQELLEVLDQLVTAERRYHSTYGRYTKLMHKLGYAVPRELSDRYGINVLDAEEDRLLVVAFSEEKGVNSDFASIDHDYMLRTNFELPTPRVEYLRFAAVDHMNVIREAKRGHSVREAGVYQGYFRYDVRKDTAIPVIVAVGTKPPVMGMELEVGLFGPKDGVEPDQVLSNFIQRFPKKFAGAQAQVTGQQSRSRAVANDLEVEPIRQPATDDQVR